MVKADGDLIFETLITILTIENLNADNHSYLTINCDTGQHSRCLLNNLLYGEPLEGCLPFILLSQTEDCSKGKAKGDGISAKMVFNAGVTKLFVSEFFTRETSKERKLIGFDKLSSLFIFPDFLDALASLAFKLSLSR